MNNDIKTWDDLCNHPDTSPTDIGFINNFEMMIEAYGQSYTASAISALALLKIRLLIAEGYEAMIEPRSGFSSRGIKGYTPVLNNSWRNFNADVLPGKIDSDYCGVLGVIIRNNDTSFTIRKGTRIAQMTFRKVESVDFIEAQELTPTDRNEGGFGSTNK